MSCRAGSPGTRGYRRSPPAPLVAPRGGPPPLLPLLDGFFGVLGAHEGDLLGGDLLEGNGERLPGDGRHLRGHDRAKAFAELVEVRVDLASPLGRKAHEGELRVHLLDEILD